jgi:hypothetical protein
MTLSSRYTVRQALGRVLHGVDAVVGVPKSSLTKSTFGVDALGVYEDDYFNDWYGHFYDGPLKDTEFSVTDFDKAGPDVASDLGILTISPDRATAVTALDLFEIYPDFSPVEMNEAINLAISMVELEALVPLVDGTLIVASNTWEYSVPEGIAYIDRIYQESNNSGRYSALDNGIDYRHWRILPGRTLWFDNAYVSLAAGRSLRLVGQKAPAQLSLDADTTEVGKAFLVYQAKALLHQSRIRGRGSDFDEHDSQMRLAQIIADRERAHIRVASFGRKVE